MALPFLHASAVSSSLKRFKHVCSAKEEGVEGIPTWRVTAEVVTLMVAFRFAVKQNNREQVEEFVRTLISEGDPDTAVSRITLLLCRGQQNPEWWKEAMLETILIGSRPLLEFIVQLFVVCPELERTGCKVSATFPPYMTPLMLAAICNNFAILELLLQRNHRLELPHRVDCYCEKCLRKQKSRGLLWRLDTYRALSSEAFLWLATSDPVTAAISLAEDLALCVTSSNGHREIYQRMLQRVQAFTAELMQQCRSLEEVQLVLNQREGVSRSACATALPRCRSALGAVLKQMVAHTNVQMLVYVYWFAAWGGGRQSFGLWLYRYARHTLFYPLLALLHALSGGALVESFRIPFARFISNMTSYGTFILAMAVLRFRDWTYFSKHLIFWLEVYVYVYAFGILVDQMIEFARRGVDNFFSAWWRWFDFAFLQVFAVAFFCWIATLTLPPPTEEKRAHWTVLEPAAMYELSFGTACVLAFSRVFYYVQMHRYVGSSVISIARCAGDVINYCVIVGLVMLAFALGICTMVQPYGQSVQFDADGDKKESSAAFNNVFITIRNLFWGFFGYLAPTDYNFVIGNAGPEGEAVDNPIVRYYSEFVVALYYVVTVITLLNLMISMLVKKADMVIDNEDLEWKYVRIHLCLEFFEDTYAVPPPFNVLYLFVLMLRRACSREFVFDGWNLFVPRDTVELDGFYEEQQLYRRFLVTMFRRYRSSKYFHYRTIQKVDTEVKENKDSRPLINYMNAYGSLSAPSKPFDPDSPPFFVGVDG